MSLGLNLFVWRHETQYRARVFHKRINNLIPLKKYALLFLCIESEILFSFYRTYIMHIKRQNYPDSMYLMWWWHGRGTWFLVAAFLFWKYYRKNSQFLQFCHILGVVLWVLFNKTRTNVRKIKCTGLFLQSTSAIFEFQNLIRKNPKHVQKDLNRKSPL